MMNKPEVDIFWFRRDLRLDDNVGLFHALQSGRPILPIFIFDRQILDKLDKPYDLRVQFIHESLEGIENVLKTIGSGITVIYATPIRRFLNSFQHMLLVLYLRTTTMNPTLLEEISPLLIYCLVRVLVSLRIKTMCFLKKGK